MKTLVIFFVGVVLGGVAGVLLAPHVFSGYMPHQYQTSKPIKLFDNEGREVGILPEGTPMIADVKLVRAPDIGWWGFVPVLFNDMWEAQDLGVVPVSGAPDIASNITLSGVRPDEMPTDEPTFDSTTGSADTGTRLDDSDNS